MSLHFPNLTTAPPGQWRYTVPETGQTFGPVPDLDGLMTQLRAHYTANGYSVPPDLKAQVEAQMCASPLLQGYCVEGESEVTPDRLTFGKIRKVTFHTVLTGTRRLLGLSTSVSQPEAERRASICVTCPENVDREDCSRCHIKTLAEIVVKIVGTRKTSFDSRLKVCRVCLCENRAAISVPLADLHNLMTPEEKAMLPSFCWKLDPITSSAAQP